MSCVSINWAEVISCLATSISALVAVLSLVLAFVAMRIAFKEYNTLKLHKQCDVLVQYNQRYAEDESIQRVVKFAVNTSMGEFVEEEEPPSVHDKEMFLRFFEELSLMVERKYIDLDDVLNLFSYYFIILWENDKFFWDDAMRAPYTTMLDAQSSNWNYARKLYKKLKKRSSFL